MQRVITINLNGNAFQLDETAYDALRAYLNLAEAQLKDNPDRSEILADFEQAIAEKCGKVLGPHKTVVTASEMDQIVKEMGPVETTDSAAAGHPGAGAADPFAAGVAPRKRLYRIREGQMVAGVCTGLAAYFNIDPAFIRVAFVLLSWTGIGLLAYFVLMAILPYAETSDERAAAHGQPPFNAQDLIDQVKKTASDFKGSAHWTRAEWRRQWREQRRQWRAQHRAWRGQWRERAGDPRSWGPWPPAPHAAYAPPVWPGYVMPVFGLVSMVCFFSLMLAIFSLVRTGGIWGWPLPAGIPLWGGILILVVLFQLVTGPIRAARHASYYAWERPGGWFAAWDGLVGMGVTILMIWLLYTHMPPPHDLGEFMRNLPEAVSALVQDFRIWFTGLIDAFR